MSGLSAVVFAAAIVSLGSGQPAGKAPPPQASPAQASPAPVITLESVAQQVNDLKVHDTLSRQLALLQSRLDAPPKPEPKDWRVEVAPWGLLAAIALGYFAMQAFSLAVPRSSDEKRIADLSRELKHLEDKVTDLQTRNTSLENAISAAHKETRESLKAAIQSLSARGPATRQKP